MTNYVFLTSATDGYFSDMYFDDLDDSMILFGNNRYYIVADEKIENIYTMVENFSGWVEDTEQLMIDLGIKINANRSAFYRCFNWNNKDESLRNVLSFITGHEWKLTEMHGSCQRDWVKCAYDTTVHNRKTLQRTEALFFGEYTEIGIIENSPLPCDQVDISDVEYWDFATYWESKEDICEKLVLNLADTVFMEEHEHHTITYTYTPC